MFPFPATLIPMHHTSTRTAYIFTWSEPYHKSHAPFPFHRIRTSSQYFFLSVHSSSSVLSISIEFPLLEFSSLSVWNSVIHFSEHSLLHSEIEYNTSIFANCALVFLSILDSGLVWRVFTTESFVSLVMQVWERNTDWTMRKNAELGWFSFQPSKLFNHEFARNGTGAWTPSFPFLLPPPPIPPPPSSTFFLHLSSYSSISHGISSPFVSHFKSRPFSHVLQS